MKNLVRGGAILSLLSLFVVLIYAQTQTESTLAIANDSQATIQNNIDTLSNTKPKTNIKAVSATDTNTDTNTETKDAKSDKTDGKKLVKTTASVRSTAAGASRGAFSASAYCFSGRTAMGHAVRRGLIAADPRVLKLGSTVYVEAGPWSGTYLVSDTGGAIKGKKIDIWVPGCSEARRFGRRSVQVFSVQ